MRTRLRHVWLALTTLPGLIVSPRRRALFGEMRSFERRLPAALRSPLLDALPQLTPAPSASAETETTTRHLADLAVLADRRSPLGLCLRRSLTRYWFLRRAGVPVVLRFGARFVNGAADRDVAGHAWLTLNGRVYHEDSKNWQGFTVMVSFPPDDSKIAS